MKICVPKRFLGGLLIFTAMFMLLRSSPLWAAEVSVSTWADISTQLNSGNSVKLADDITAGNSDEAITVDKTSTLDLNGYTLNANNAQFSVITVNGTGITFTLKDTSTGKTGKITGGHGTNVNTGGGDYKNLGGGIYVYDGTFNMEGGNITGNHANFGGGIYVAESSMGSVKLNITGGSITNNTASHKDQTTPGTDANGGGIYLANAYSHIIENCVISSNTAERNGGGIAIQSRVDAQTITIKNSVISGNTAQGKGSAGETAGYGGGIHNPEGNLKIYACSITDNTAKTNGGGLFVQGGNASEESLIDIAHSTFINNSDHAIYYECKLTLKNSLVWNSGTSFLPLGYAGSYAAGTVTDCAFNEYWKGTNIYATQAYIPSDWQPVSKDITSNGKTFRLYSIEDNLSALGATIDKATPLSEVTQDIFGNPFRGSAKRTIGAAEYMSGQNPKVTVNCSADSLPAKDGESFNTSLTFTASPDIEGLTWAVSPSDTDGISAAFSGNSLTFSGTPSKPGAHTFTVSAKHNGVECGTKDIAVNVAAKLNSIEISASDKTLNLKEEDPEVSLTLTVDKITATYSDNVTKEITASVSWSAAETLPAGITLEGNVLKVASTTAPGNHGVKIRASASYTYNGKTLTADKIITVTVNVPGLDSLTISASDKTLNLKVDSDGSLTLSVDKITATYSDNSTKDISDVSVSWSAVETLPVGITLEGNVLKVASTTAPGNHGVKIRASASYTYNGKTLTASKDITVTVNVAVPKNLTFDKASITIDFDVDEGVSVSDYATVTVKDQNGNDITALGEIVCEKTTPDFDGLTSTVDGKKITFTALAEKVSASKTVQFTVSFRYNGKDYLKTSYKVELYVTRVSGYYLTLSPVEINVIPGKTASLNLKNSVKFEKVFANNHRQTVEDAKMIFSLNNAASWINCDPDSGVVTLNPGADVENGTLNYLYIVEADYDGNRKTEIADFKVNVVKKSPAITTETLPTAMTGNTYSQTLTATGASPITWTKTGGELPDGLTLNASTGKISGIPSDSGGGKTFKFTVQASNAYGTDSREFSIEVIRTKGVVPASWTYSLTPASGSLLKKSQTFYFKRRVAKGENIDYDYQKVYIPSGIYLKSVFAWDAADGAVKEGVSYITFTLKYTGATHDYVFRNQAIKAWNDYGESYSPQRTITVTKDKANYGKISLSAQDTPDGLITLADDEDGGEELSGSMYFDDGGTDEDGNITGVIGGENAKFKTLADFIASLKEEEYAKVIRIEFRKGAEDTSITAGGISKLTGLLEIAVDESETLTEFNLNGNKTIESVSIFKCSALEKLDVKNCVALYHLEAAQCPKLTALDVEGCSLLEAIWLNGSSVTNLNLSGSDFANVADIDLTECNSLTSLNVDGCAALSNLYAPYTAVTSLNLKNNPELTDVFLNETQVSELDLSNNPKLKSLSLVGAGNLEDLKLADGVQLEEFELTDSKVTGMTLAGYGSAELALSGNTELTSLTVTDSPLVEIIRLDGCAKLATLNLEGCPNVKEIYLNGTALTALSLNGYEKLTSLDVSGCESLTALDVRGNALRYLNVEGCTALATLNCPENSLGWLKLEGLEALTEVICAGQTIGDWTPTTTLDLKLYAGDDISRVSEVYGYDSNGVRIEPSGSSAGTGSTETSVAENEAGIIEFPTVPSRVEYLYDTKYNDLKMDVTITGESVERDGTNGSGGGCDLVRSEELGGSPAGRVRSVLLLAFLLIALATLKLRRL